MSEIGTLAVDLTAETSSFNKSILESENAVKDFTSQVAGIQQAMLGSVKGIKGMIKGMETLVRRLGEVRIGVGEVKNALGDLSKQKPNLSENVKKMKGMFDALDAKLKNFGKSSDEQEKEKFKQLAESEFGKGTDRYTQKVLDYENKLKKLYNLRQMKDIADGLGNSFANAFDRVRTGAVTTTDALKLFIQEVGAMVMKITVTQPLAKAISAGLMGLFNPTAGSVTTAQMSKLNAAADQWMGVGLRHSGRPGRSRYVPSALFDNAPRFHNGLSSDEFPAILQQGETVIPKGQKANQLQVINKVEVFNQSSQPVNAESGPTRFNGKEYVTTIVLNDLGRNGPIRQAMQGI